MRAITLATWTAKLNFAVLGCSLAWGQGLEVQTDWSGGPNLFGPVEHWADRCLIADGTAWRSIPGQLALATTPLEQPIQRIIVGDADHSQHCAAADLDGDGDWDVLTSDPVYDVFGELGAIRWWERQPDGTWTQHTVDDDFYGAGYVAAADVDRDGDMDVIAAAYYGLEDVTPYGNENGRYAWFENVSGDGSVWQQHVIGELFWGAQWIDAGDLDGDGDVDIVGASYLTDGVWIQDGDVTWFENLDGAGTQWAQHDLETERSGMQAHVADIDGDGDLDVVGAESDRIAWWENRNGDGSLWITRYVSTQLNGSSYLSVGDLDDDGDLDVVGGAYGTAVIVWWENTAGNGTVWFPRYIVNGTHVFFLDLRDVDGDGDLDAALSGSSSYYGFIYWLENASGDGIVWNPRLITDDVEGYNWVALGDVNNDGRLDAVVVDEGIDESTHQLSWYDLTRFGATGNLISSVLDGGTSGHWGQIEWNADQPASTTLAVFARASNDPYNLGQFVAVPASGTNLATLIDPGAQYFQYRLDLTTSDNTASPIVHDIAVQQRAIGDLNCDGSVDFGDINPFVLTLTNPEGYAAQYPECNILNADINGDGEVDFGDINPFVALLTSASP